MPNSLWKIILSRLGFLSQGTNRRPFPDDNYLKKKAVPVLGTIIKALLASFSRVPGQNHILLLITISSQSMHYAHETYTLEWSDKTTWLSLKRQKLASVTACPFIVQEY